MENFLGYSYIGFYESVMRLGLALILGYLIGIDRYFKHKPVDIRVYIIVCLATCAISLMGQGLYFDYAEANEVVRIDLTQIISGTLTGIGFLGAGAIIKQSDQKVIGSATGASIWASGGIGLSLGFGYYGLAVLTALMVAATLYLFGLFTNEDE